MRLTAASAPLAITMWDFSWLERRWPGAGYEDWDLALEQLADRGYDIVRIDAYPHLVAADSGRAWTLRPFWNQQAWGAQSVVAVQVLPALVDFITVAARHGIRVSLSTWFREDVDNVRMQITTPEKLARAWIETLDHLADADLLANIAFVDLCNEFPHPNWAPFLYASEPGLDLGRGMARSHPTVNTWMREAIEAVRAAYPQLDLTFSFSGRYEDADEVDVEAFDLLEPHLWMANASDFNDIVGYHFERFDPTGYDNLVSRGRATYESDPERFDRALYRQIDLVAQWSRETGKPVATTECWSVIDYKDWPGLDWDWIMDLNERALRHALATGRWIALGTSNFCGPQFVGMWRDLDYHRRLTKLIHDAEIDAVLLHGDRAAASH